MAITKVIKIDGKKVPFRASATLPRLYRLKFGKDIFKDFLSLKKTSDDENENDFDIESLEVFENIAYIMAKHADPENVPADPDEWLEQFSTFSIYKVFPEIFELWGRNNAGIDAEVAANSLILALVRTIPPNVRKNSLTHRTISKKRLPL